MLPELQGQTHTSTHSPAEVSGFVDEYALNGTPTTGNTFNRRNYAKAGALGAGLGLAAFTVATVESGCATPTAVNTEPSSPTATNTPDTCPIPQSGADAKSGSSSANVEKPNCAPEYQTNESYADYLWLNQNNPKLSDADKAAYAAMTAGNPLARAEKRYAFKAYGGWNELPTEGMIVFTNTKVEAAPVGPNTPDGKLLTGTIDFGFFKDGVPYLIKIQTTTVDSRGYTNYNIGWKVSASDWTTISSFPGPDPLMATADKMDAYFKANAGKEAILGFSIPNPAASGGVNWVNHEINTESNLKNANALIQWLRNKGSRPDFVIGPNATQQEIAQAPNADVLMGNFSSGF